jgi:hypothetical protein
MLDNPVSCHYPEVRFVGEQRSELVKSRDVVYQVVV